MKYLITGGAGFLGSHLCDYLLSKGNDVICIDNLFTGRIENIKHNLNKETFKFIEHDIINPIDIECDRIYNLACPASPPHYQFDPIKTAKTSFLGALNMLELAKKYNARIFQASTSEIYGDPIVHPQIEEYWGNVNCDGIRACYDEGKRIAETLFNDYHRQYNVDIRIVRIFNTYGPRMLRNDGRVISNFIIQALNDIDITVYGDGTQTRSFCYVDDLINGFDKLMNSNITNPINIGNPGEFTMLELAEKIIKHINSKSKIIFKELPADDPKQRRPDITKAKTLLNWEPTINLDTGLEKTINYFKRK